MPAKSIVRSSTLSAARISLALLLVVLLVFPDGVAMAQSACNTAQWEQSSVSLQNPIETFASAVKNNYLYVIGGFDSASGAFQTQVGHSKLNSSTGALGAFTWQNLWSLQGETQPVGLSRYLCGAVYTSPTTGNSYIYTVGGEIFDPVAKSTSLTGEIHFAQLNSSTGNIGTWQKANLTLNPALDLHGTVVLNGYLYIIGGSTNNSNPPAGLTDQVLYARINPSTGNLAGTAFTQGPPIESATNGIYKTCPVIDAATNTIYVTGGETNNGAGNNPATANVVFAVQGSNGALTDGNGNNQWGMATSLQSILAAQAVVYNNGIILMGGDTTGKGPDTGAVQLGTIMAPPQTISWTNLPSLTNLLNVVERNSGATNSTFIYSLGGEVTQNRVTSDTNAIYCLKR